MTDFHSRNGDSSSGDPRRVFIPTPAGGAPAPTRPRPQGAPGRPPGARGPMVPARERPPGGPTRPRPTRPTGPPPPPGGKRSWFRRLRWKRVLAIFTAVMVLSVAGLFWWANSIFGRIERVDLEGALAGGGGGTNYLIVGSDTRDVLSPDDPEVNQDVEAAPGGQRSDTMMLLRFEGGEAKIMSIPRDLYVTIADTGEQGKINGAYNGGPPRLVRTISENLDIPIHRYLEVDFASFAGLVDGLGGITIEFPHPAFDTNSGLNVTQTGPVTLDGEQALGYVRSRNYTEVIDGENVKDPTADLGRILRQQAFLKAVFAKLGDAKNPLTLARTASKVTDGLRIDDQMSLLDAMRFAWRLRGLNPAPLELPVENDRIGRAAVLLLQEEAAQPILDEFR